MRNNENKGHQGKATFTVRSPRHYPVILVGHPNGIKPKLGEDTRAVKGGEITFRIKSFESLIISCIYITHSQTAIIFGQMLRYM
jgi:hypothetical protein